MFFNTSMAVAFGPNSSSSENVGGVFAIVFAILIFGSLGWVILKLLRMGNRSARSAPQKIVKRVVAAARPGEAMVTFKYTTYTGFGLWMNQLTAEYRLPASQAKPTLDGLLKHNLTRGLLGPGLIFVPVLALIDYWKQGRMIAQQTAQGFAVEKGKRN